jgi:hypothetical protein
MEAMMRGTMKRAGWSSVAILMCVWGVGCARTPAPPGLITHVVFSTLDDPADARALIRDCDEWIAPIPGITSYACGAPYDSGRARVDGGYDVGMVLGFASEAAYEAYVTHPNHVRLVEKWRPRTRVVEIRDVIDERE